MLTRGILLAAVLSSLAACHRAVPTVGTTPASASDEDAPVTAPRPEEAYVSDLTAIAFGDAFTRATADGAPATDSRASGADQAIDAAASRDGDELRRSCGSEGAQSHAQATAAFQPLPVLGVRQFGFSLSTTTYAKGGLWRGQFVVCRGSHNTLATADARATGRLELTLNASGDASDTLILRVSGATAREAHLEVRDGQNRLIPLRSVPGETWVAATLPRPGAYSVQASIAVHSEHGGSGKAPAQRGTSFSVSVQSMRDALALGFARGPSSAVTLPLPVFMSTDAMSVALDSALFTDQHRLYPCARVDCGTDRLRDVYLETPRVSTSGGSVVLDMGMSGSYQVALIFGGGVSGAIRATAVPVVEHDTLRFEAPSIDVATHNLIVKWRAGSFERKLLDRIRNVRIDLTPQLEAAVAKAQDQLSVSWGGACLLLTATEAHVRSVRVVTIAPQGIVADFDIELSEAPGSACQKRKAMR